MNPFLITLMKNFIKAAVPHEIIKAATIDGANDWFTSSLCISTPQEYSLQSYLYNMLNNTQAMREMA